jgi:hypothetical protein
LLGLGLGAPIGEQSLVPFSLKFFLSLEFDGWVGFVSEKFGTTTDFGFFFFFGKPIWTVHFEDDNVIMAVGPTPKL